MKLMKTALIFSLICVLVGNASATTAEGTDYVQELLRAEAPENAVFGETVALADALQFSIPADWERSSEYDDEEMCSFLYTGTDGAGRKLMFLGAEAGSESLGEELSSYVDLKNMLDEADTLSDTDRQQRRYLNSAQALEDAEEEPAQLLDQIKRRD